MKKVLISATKLLFLCAIPIAMFATTTQNFTAIGDVPVSEAMTFLCRALFYFAAPVFVIGACFFYHNRKPIN